MQQKESHNENDKTQNENLPTTSPTETTAEDGVVYVENNDGTEFDTSERTYVTVEGLQGEVGSDDTTEKAKDDDA